MTLNIQETRLNNVLEHNKSRLVPSYLLLLCCTCELCSTVLLHGKKIRVNNFGKEIRNPNIHQLLFRIMFFVQRIQKSQYA